MTENTESTETPSSEAQPPEGAFADLLGSIKEGDRQKYTSVEDALKSIEPAQTHIRTLEEENEALKKKVEEATKLEELMAKLEEKKATKVADQPEGALFDESKLSEIIRGELTAKERADQERANMNTVKSAFEGKYGDKAEEIYNKVAQESGLGGDELRNLAARAPQAVLKLAGLSGERQEKQPSPTRQTVRTESFGSEQEKPSARVPMVGYTTADLISAWRATQQS